MPGTSEGNKKRAKTLGKAKLREIAEKVTATPGRKKPFRDPEFARKAANARWAKRKQKVAIDNSI